MTLNMEGLVENYLLNRGSGNTVWKYPLLGAVTYALYKDVAESTKRMECYFCGKKFRRKNGVVIHIIRAHGGELKYIVYDVIETYRRLRSRMRVVWRDGRYYVRLELNSINLRFPSVGELAGYVMAHPEVLRELDGGSGG